MNSGKMTPAALARTIDHAVLKPTATREDLLEGVRVAIRHNCAGLCVRPCDITEAAAALSEQPNEVALGTVIGFPHGTTSTAAKVAESRQAVTDGAAELDMVVNIAWMLDGRLDEVRREITAVVAAAEKRLVKVILECCYLNREQIVAACKASEAAGADFVKTSTGFGSGGATVEDVRLMRNTVGAACRIKASGGIRTLGDALSLIEAGADRLGLSGTEKVISDLAAQG